LALECLGSTPDEVTCGPTCLAAVYSYYGRRCTVEDVIEEIRRNPTAAPGRLPQDFRPATRLQGHLYTYNMRVLTDVNRPPGRRARRKLRKRRKFVRSSICRE
jgi:hypothetical protein